MRSFNEELLLVSRLILGADDALSRGDDISMRLGVITMDLAVETLLKITLGQTGVMSKPEANFRDILRAVIQSAAPKNVSYVNGLDSMRSLRNLVQHHGIQPNPADARRQGAAAKVILQQLSLDMFSMDVTNISLVSLIKSTDLSTPLRSASDLINLGKYAEAVGLCKEAFDTLMRRWTAYFQSLWGLREGPQDLFANIASSLSAGIYLPDLKRFREITQDASFGGISSSEQLRAAQFCLEFVAGWAIRIEGRLG